MKDAPRRDGKTAGGGSAAAAARRGRGFTRAGGLITRQVSTVAARRGFAEARLAALWPEIVGPELAALATPVKLATSRSGGVLTVAVAAARGPELQMLLPALRERVNAALGPNAVARIALTQTGGRTGAGFAEAAPPYVPPPPAVPDAGPLAGDLACVADGELRSALDLLARNVLSRRGQARGRS